MKKNAIYISLVCFILCLSIIFLDFYRAQFVRSEKKENEGEDVCTSDDISALAKGESEENNRVDFVVFGENLIHERVLDYANLLAGGRGERSSYSAGFDFYPIYKNVEKIVAEADFALFTQSSLVGANDDPASLSGYPLFNSPSKLGRDLIQMGFDGVNIATNHALDMSDSGFLASVNFWQKQDIKLIGGYQNLEEKERIDQKIVDISGMKVAFLSYTATTNGLTPKDGATSIPYLALNDTAVLKKMLENEVSAAKKACDFVIVFVNWGNEAGYQVSEMQQDVAHTLSSAGADVIIGSGPKVIQKLTWILSESGQQTLCAYSLGNMMGTMSYMDNLFSGCLRFSLEKDEVEVKISNILFQPLVIHYDENVSDISLIELEKYSEEEFLLHGSNINHGFGKYTDFRDVLKREIPTEYLPASLRA